ncbi:hypothetical protein SAMN05192539_104922 [Paraburkholderia diazotrophica]|uniref:Uncharacterized protein n=1 Tax=Paraburkholderia diazotrophica TaxID=667676 RepID=A0A1H7EAA7_9BURK|nr:hypothetical protein SAMN05192539_104922 [Paraburkholderia diazotrophica]
MKGILRLAFKLLVNDSAKFTALIVGITLAVFLMIEMTSIFARILNKSSSTVINVGAKMWVMDPAVQTIASSIGMPDCVLDAVRSIDGVKYAVPLYSGVALVRLRDGTYPAATVIGLHDASLFGLLSFLQLRRHERCWLGGALHRFDNGSPVSGRVEVAALSWRCRHRMHRAAAIASFDGFGSAVMPVSCCSRDLFLATRAEHPARRYLLGSRNCAGWDSRYRAGVRR